MHRKRFLFIISSAVMIIAGLFYGMNTAMAQDVIPETGMFPEGQLTFEELQAMNNNQAEVFVHNDRVTFVSGTCTPDPVTSMEDAEKVVATMISLLGGDARTRFENWRTLTDASGNQYYVFQQMYANTTVLGGAVKVITDSKGNMIGLTSSIETELPEAEESEGITLEEAEQIILQHAAETNQPEMTILEEVSAKMILPVTLVLDIYEEDENAEAARFVWAVYTNNPASSLDSGADLPYLAHYVTMDGEYLYNLATIIPGDAAGKSGFDAAYVFEFMEPADYTGYVDLSDGTEMELTVTVMRDKRTGMYYLGNIERQIVVADCYEFLYNNGNVVLAFSPDNLEWDQVGLLSLYYYCRAYDYYREIGWIGGDGLGTPIMILNDMCDEHHNRIDNAAFLGNYLGWSLFGASLANDFSQAQDVIAHEFTHCVTGTVMTYNSYLNDYGAINEAMSDIQGQICDLMYGNEDDVTWLLGDKSLTPVRSMSDPHLFDQPEFSWDLYYIPAVKSPTAINDQGGVHTNSSLLNNVAYRLVTDGGMSLEEARAFWFAVDCAMVPGTDYPQLRELLPWTLKMLGMDRYQTSLQHAIDAVRLGNDVIPDFFDDDRALLTLVLPDNENFTDGNWMMNLITVDLDFLIAKAEWILSHLLSKDYSAFPQEIQDLLQGYTEVDQIPAEEKPGFWEALAEALTEAFEEMNSETPDEAAASRYNEPEDIDILIAWLKEEFSEGFYWGRGSAGQDGRTIRMVVRPGRTIPMMMHVAINDMTTEMDQMVNAVYLNDTWYVLEDQQPLDDAEENASSIMESPIVDDLLNNVMANIENIHSMDDVLDMFSVRIVGGEVNELPSTGLEKITLPEPADKTGDGSEPAELPEPGSKSRPKL